MRFEIVEFLNLILNKLLQALMKCLGVIIQSCTLEIIFSFINI